MSTVPKPDCVSLNISACIMRVEGVSSAFSSNWERQGLLRFVLRGRFHAVPRVRSREDRHYRDEER
jgi:hypothetical protein